MKRRKRSLTYLDQISYESKIKWSEIVRPLVRDKRFPHFFSSFNNATLSQKKVEQKHPEQNTGKGVVIAILDDGVDYTHPAIQASYRADLSFDFTHDKMDAKPEKSKDNNHGTNCAGIVVMPPASACGVGAAYGSKVAGLKMLGGDSVNDVMEGEALLHKFQEIDIYSVSWGPKDDGRSMEGPHRLAQIALSKGYRMGRSGKGSIYIWASGNGGLEHDDCAMDGYASNIYTITFGMFGEGGSPVWYTEGCPAIMASLSAEDNHGFRTTDVDGACTFFTGSSAAAPLASGIIALVLEENPNLTQRDVQHLIVRTSNSSLLAQQSPSLWKVNGAGLNVSRMFGFGSLDAKKLIKNAAVWKNVEKENICSKELVLKEKITFTHELSAVINIPFPGCQNTSSEVNYVEKVELQVSIHHDRRGDIVLDLESPSGTVIRLLERRIYDNSEIGILNWPFVASHFWGENAVGVWKLYVHDEGKTNGGVISHLNLLVIGTENDVMKNVEII
ncbi:unnamed protein product [Auanema sp. JU1783]|nr:unnamed protein product [Auanema sp. JU1783]